MDKIEIVYANEKHRNFIIYSNSVINNINNQIQTNELEKNIDNDYYSDNPKFKCLIAEVDDNPVGMILYSYFYWANDGEVLWISQMYIEKEYRKYGIFFKLINKLKEENPNIKVVSCATGNENIRMQKILKFYDVHEINLKFYYKKIK